MTPYEKARKVYKRRELDRIIRMCAEIGMVHADSECFFCAYPTHHSLLRPNLNSLIEQNLNKSVDIADTWYVYIASGNPIRALEFAKPLKYIAYERFDDKFRLIEVERLRRLLWAV